MMGLEPGIRNGVRAVILRERQLLLLRKAYEDGSERYVLPGGAQDAGETLTDALQRECREEIGTEVTVSGLLYLADYFKPRTAQPGVQAPGRGCLGRPGPLDEYSTVTLGPGRLSFIRRADIPSCLPG
jgi:8-oxo-dGTP pyrophosphatase MutT (NUDIX family)